MVEWESIGGFARAGVEESLERAPDPMRGVATSALARRVSRLNTVLT